MTKEELVTRIKQHERSCSTPETSFRIVEVSELADGILGARDTDGERTIYYDKAKWRDKDGAFDISPRIPSFPSDTGFISGVPATGWAEMLHVAKQMLTKVGRAKRPWHKQPVSITY